MVEASISFIVVGQAVVWNYFWLYLIFGNLFQLAMYKFQLNGMNKRNQVLNGVDTSIPSYFICHCVHYTYVRSLLSLYEWVSEQKSTVYNTLFRTNKRRKKTKLSSHFLFLKFWVCFYLVPQLFKRVVSISLSSFKNTQRLYTYKCDQFVGIDLVVLRWTACENKEFWMRMGMRKR